jgi:predicted kinase
MKLVLIRGLPGSGKSTLADDLRRLYSFKEHGVFRCDEWVHCEADQFFVKNGEYRFDPLKIFDAHKFCKQKCADALVMDWNVIVSNTFSRIWEMQPYLDLAKQFDAEVTVLTCEGNFGNIHGVPENVIEKMRARWEPYRP